MKLLLLLIMTTASSQGVHAQSTSLNNYHAWWKEKYLQKPAKNPKAKLLPLIIVKGNKFVNAGGETILFRGVSIADPDKIYHEGHWNKLLFEKAKDMGVMLVRIPVHPAAWRDRSPLKYLSLLDSAVSWCTDLGMYVDIDWHSIGNLEMELFQDAMYNTTLKETYEFWQTIARHFTGNNTVAFYELFNEPTTYRGQLGNISWSTWKKINENIIQLIRTFDNETIPLVAGFDWAYDLTPLREEPINAIGIGYVTHPYPNKRSQPWEPKWEEDFGFAAQRYPVLATEMGFNVRKGDPEDGAENYGTRITKYLENNGIGWLAWNFDPEWGPQLLSSWDYELTGSGKFFKAAMHK
ncbi:glycoside hydrolase family 5 protein [Ginsengibacter hankyongi]|uniref:Glycoside hydrolase family 5 protein n=2 Tax=Ginsengibacter hankyongi TaxID=2607284 RepID=A0A5J5IM48_9BACT|nr:glycoside hydrolase family 5 protein [Ginsengibacter hankyongi]